MGVKFWGAKNKGAPSDIWGGGSSHCELRTPIRSVHNAQCEDPPPPVYLMEPPYFGSPKLYIVFTQKVFCAGN